MKQLERCAGLRIVREHPGPATQRILLLCNRVTDHGAHACPSRRFRLGTAHLHDYVPSMRAPCQTVSAPC